MRPIRVIPLGSKSSNSRGSGGYAKATARTNYNHSAVGIGVGRDELSTKRETEKLIHELRDPGVFHLKKNPKTGVYIVDFTSDDFKLPSKIYGDFKSRVKKIIKQYDETDSNLGVLLYKLKGTGKTLVMQAVANHYLDEGMSSIIIQEPFNDSEFMSLMETIPPSVVMFDEIDKVYKGKTESLQSMIDGLGQNEHIFLLSTNDVGNVADAFKSRPGRIYYAMEFNGITTDELEEALVDQDMLLDPVKKFIRYIVGFRSNISWDVYNSLVNEGLKLDAENELYGLTDEEVITMYSEQLKDLNTDANDIMVYTIDGTKGVTNIRDTVRYRDVSEYMYRALMEFDFNDKTITRSQYISALNDSTSTISLGVEDTINITGTRSTISELYKNGVKPIRIKGD